MDVKGNEMSTLAFRQAITGRRDGSFCASSPDREIEAEFRRAHRIIQKLARLVRHYGYAEEMPNLRTAERLNIIGKPRRKTVKAKKRN